GKRLGGDQAVPVVRGDRRARPRRRAVPHDAITAQRGRDRLTGPGPAVTAARAGHAPRLRTRSAHRSGPSAPPAPPRPPRPVRAARPGETGPRDWPDPGRAPGAGPRRRSRGPGGPARPRRAESTPAPN